MLNTHRVAPSVPAVYVFFRLVEGKGTPAWSRAATRLDNTVAIGWATKGRARSPAAFDLARLACLAEFAFGNSTTCNHIAGVDNVAADALSRWNEVDMPAAFRAAAGGVAEVEVTTTMTGRAGRARRLLRRVLTGKTTSGWLNRVAAELADECW